MDLRLLIPALVSWSLVALLLGSATTHVIVASIVSSVVAGLTVTFSVASRRRGPRHPPAAVGPNRSLRDAWFRLTALTAVAASLALAALAGNTALREAGPVRRLSGERATVTVVATVASDPKVLPVAPGRPEGNAQVLVQLDVEDITARGEAYGVHTPVVLFADMSWLGVSWRSRVEATGRLAPAADPSGDSVAVLIPRGPPTVLDQPDFVTVAADSVRHRFAEATQSLPPDARGLLPGLVLGDTARTPVDLDDAMLVTGMTHLSAVSGSNVAIVLAAALGLARILGLRRRWRPIVASFLLCGFVVLVRPEPSVLRAAVMGAVGVLGMTASRRRAGVSSLGVALLVLVCYDPWLSRSPGFALSTLATLGLILFAKPWGIVLGRLLPRPIKGWGEALAIPCAAQLMCAPVIVLLQGSVSLVAVVANLLAAPFVAPATLLGVAAALTSVISIPLAGGFSWLAAIPTLVIAKIARIAADVPLATVPWPDTGSGALLLGALGLIALFGGPWLLHHAYRRPLVPVAVGSLGLAAAVPTHLVTWPMALWSFVACDVGQGDGLVLSTGPGRAVVVDTGPDPALIDSCLGRLGVAVVDAVVLTHFHADHVDGLPGVLRGRTVRHIFATPVRDPAYQWQEVSGWAETAGIPLSQVYAGDDLAWAGVTAHVWWPQRVIHEGSVPNNASVVMTVVVAGLRLLLLGDVEREAAHEVVRSLRQDQARSPPAFDVVKVAHHGSANRDDDLLALARAPIAVVSVGADNDYGHPAASTINRLTEDGFRVYRTDLVGDIAVRKGAASTVEVATRK